MSQIFNKSRRPVIVRRMDDVEVELPIFPLAVVLVPGELLPLHIFEERYKQMMRHVLDDERHFGLSFVDHAEVGSETPPAIGSVGCEAQVSAVVPLAEGRMNLLTIGSGRFVIKSFSQLSPFLIARVERFSDMPDESPEVESLADKVRMLFDRLAAAARTLSNDASEQGELEHGVTPEALSFLVAANIALDNPLKQEMLEMTNTMRRLAMLDEKLESMVETYEYRATMHGRSKGNGHGKKPPVVDED